MLEIDLRRFQIDPEHIGQLKLMGDTAKTIAARSNREAVGFLMQAIGLSPLTTRAEGYYELALNYTLALVHAYANEPEAAAERLALSRILPFDGGDLIFSEANERALNLAAQQEDSLGRHVPCVFISSMPRSASAALAATISDTFGCPIMRASIGGFPNSYLMPSWVRRVTRGGCVLHDHFGANEFNLKVLSDCAVRTVFVLIRDPRASAVSAAQFGRSIGLNASEDEIQDLFDNIYIPWLRGWEEFAARSAAIEVIWLKSAGVTAGIAQLRSVLESIIEPLARSATLWRPDLSKLTLAEANFVSGTPDGWRRHVSKAVQERMWSSVPARFREMLELEP